MSDTPHTKRIGYSVESRHDKWEPGNCTVKLEVVTEIRESCHSESGIMQHPKRFVHGSPFGCSRDYYCETDQEAIRKLLAEHGAVAASIEKLN
jgi:hypothetical protein